MYDTLSLLYQEIPLYVVFYEVNIRARRHYQHSKSGESTGEPRQLQACQQQVPVKFYSNGTLAIGKMSEEKNEASDQQKFKKRKRIQALEVQEFYGINSVQRKSRKSGKSTSVTASVDERNRSPSLEIVPSFAPGEFIRVWGGFLTFPG